MIMDQEEWYDGDLSWQEIEKNYFYIDGHFTFYSVRPAWYLRMMMEEEFEKEMLASCRFSY